MLVWFGRSRARIIGVSPEAAGVSDKQAAAACGMPLLLNAYKQVGHEYGFEIAQILLTLGDFEDHRRFLNTRNTVHRLFEAGVVPIVNENDSITTEQIRVGDNDRLAAKVAQMVGASDLIILTGVDGLYDRNPDDPEAQFIPEVEDVSDYMDATKGKSTLGTGGMATKLQAANMAQEAGVTTWIAQGEVDRPLSTVLSGERRSTKVLANPNPLSGWDSWNRQPSADGRQPRPYRRRRCQAWRGGEAGIAGRHPLYGRRLHPGGRAAYLRPARDRACPRPQRFHGGRIARPHRQSRYARQSNCSAIAARGRLSGPITS